MSSYQRIVQQITAISHHHDFHDYFTIEFTEVSAVKCAADWSARCHPGEVVAPDEAANRTATGCTPLPLGK